MAPCIGQTVDGRPLLQAAFRGRKLKGVKLPVPPGFEASLLQRDSTKSTEWVNKASFTELTYWNHDADPMSTDPMQKGIDWMHLASKLHMPIACEEVEAQMQKRQCLSAN